MTTRHVEGLLQTTDWQESTWDGRTATMDDWPEAPFESVTAASAEWQGELSGPSTQRWLMTYDSSNDAVFVGLERVHASIDGRAGALVLLHRGSYLAGEFVDTFDVVGSDGALKGTTGTGSIHPTDEHRTSRYLLDVDLPG